MHPYSALTPAQQRLLAALLTASVTVCYGFGLYLFPLLLSDMRLSLGFDYAAVGWMTALSQGGYMLGALLGAWLGQRLGELRLISWALSVTCISLIVLSQGQSLYSIAPALVLCGVWASLVWVPMVTVVARYFPPQHSGRLMGLLASGTHYGVFINGLLVPWLLEHNTWPHVWLSFAVLSSGLLLLLVGFLYRQRQSLRSYCVNPSTRAAGSTSARLAGRTRILAILFLTGFSCMPYQNYLAPYLRDELGISSIATGTVVTAVGLVGMLSGFILGRVADRTHLRFTFASIQMVLLVSISLLWLKLPYSGLLSAGLLFGLAISPTWGLPAAYISRRWSTASAARLFGLGNLLLGTGGALGNLLAGMSMQQFGSLRPFYALLTLAVWLTILLALKLPAEQASDSRYD